MSDNFEEKDGVWRTISGRRVFIRDGESLTDAIKRSGKFEKSEETHQSKRSYNDLDSDEKKKFRRWYRKHAEELAQKYKDSDDVRKAAQDEWLSDHSSSENPEKVTNKTKEISDKIKEQRQSKEAKQAQDDNIQHDYSQGHWDPETKSYVLDDGHKVGMLPKKEYKKLSQEQYENSSEETKEIVNSYTISQATASSCDLNKITPESIASGRRLDSVTIAREPGLIISQRERDMLDDEMYEDWVKNYESRKDLSQYELEVQWRKAWDLNHGDLVLSPWQLKPSAYDSTLDPKTGRRIIWTDDEVAEAKAVGQELTRIEKERSKAASKYGYDSPEYEAFEKEREQVIDAIENERLKIKNRSAYWYREIGRYNETMLYKRDLDVENLIKEGKLEYLNTQEQIDLDLDDNLKSMQPTDTIRRIDNLKEAVKQFDDAFKNDGIVLDHDIMVYRRSYENSREIDEGYTKLGYTSTSAQDTLPKKMPSGIRFGEIEQYIIVPKGTKVLFAEDIIGYDHKDRPDYVSNGYKHADDGLKRQHEIILPRGTSFKKVGKVTENGWNTRAYILKADVKEEYKNGKRN